MSVSGFSISLCDLKITHIYSRLILLLLLSCASNLVNAITTPDFILKNNRWEQLVIPAETSRMSVRELFADDLPAEQYGSTWVMYLYDNTSNQYIDPGIDGTLPQSSGFWMLQQTGSDRILDLPETINASPTQSSTACPLATCSEASLSTPEGNSTYSMLGSALTSSVQSQLLRIRTQQNENLCTDGCDLAEAAGYNYISPTLLRWDTDSASYINLDTVGTIKPWQSFWMLTLAGASNTNASLLFPAGISASFAADNTNFPNPERGFHSGGNLLGPYGFSEAQAKGYTLVRTYVRLDDYTDTPIPDSFINDLNNGFNSVRQNNVKLVLRFSYNFGFDGQDTTLERVLQHIDQLTPLLRNNADVIAVLQAGFIGAWGEWHGSDFDLDSVENKARIHAALMEAVSKDRMVQLRTPVHISQIYPSPLETADYFSNSDHARTAFHNDCFLANENDAGTYPSDRREELQAYLDQATPAVAVGGETCQVSVERHRTDCVTAVAELDRFNWDYLNIGFYKPALDRWRAEGCFEEVERRLGYRFEMIDANASASVAPGDILSVNLQLANVGFGKLYNPRSANLILRHVDSGFVTRIPVSGGNDLRKSLPLSGQRRSIDLSGITPADLPAGNYELLLELPDAASTLADKPEYSVRMANLDVWESATGFNRLNLEIQVTD